MANDAEKLHATDTPPAPKKTIWTLLNLIVLTAVAAVLMLYELGEKPLAADEATSYFMAWVPWDDFWYSITTSEANASLFYALLRLPVAFGSDPALLRLIPALCGILTIPVLYLLLERLFGRWTAAVGAAALAVNTFFVVHAQDVRGYSMAAFFATLATWLFVLSVEKPTAVRLALYVLAGVAGIYSHFFCALVMAAHFLSLPLLPARTVRWRRFITAYAVAVVLSVPLAYFVLTNDHGQVDWIPDTTFRIVLKSLNELAGDGGAALAAVVGVCVLLAVGRAVLAGIRHRRSPELWASGLIVLWLVIPLLFAGVVSVVKPLFVARYLLPALPAVGGAIGLGIGLLRLRPLIALAGAGVVALTAMQLPDWYAEDRLDWTERADTVISAAQPGDAMIFYSPPVIRPFGYYSGFYAPREDGEVAPDPIYPPVDWLGYSRTRFRPNYDRIIETAARYERVWFVTGYARDRPRRREMMKLISALEENCTRVPGYGGAVDLYEDCRAPNGAA